MNLHVPIHFQIGDFLMFLQNERNTGEFTTFCHCWRSDGDNTEMHGSPAEYGKFGNYGHSENFLSRTRIRFHGPRSYWASWAIAPRRNWAIASLVIWPDF